RFGGREVGGRCSWFGLVVPPIATKRERARLSLGSNIDGRAPMGAVAVGDYSVVAKDAIFRVNDAIPRVFVEDANRPPSWVVGIVVMEDSPVDVDIGEGRMAPHDDIPLGDNLSRFIARIAVDKT